MFVTFKVLLILHFSELYLEASNQTACSLYYILLTQCRPSKEPILATQCRNFINVFKNIFKKSNTEQIIMSVLWLSHT